MNETIKKFYNADDVSNILVISKSAAYKAIRKLNEELKVKGYFTISGKVPVKYFEEKFYCW